MKFIDHKDAINRRLYKGLIIVKTAIYRVSSLNRTVLRGIRLWQTRTALPKSAIADKSALYLPLIFFVKSY
ncbi:hypothetical protein [Nostoc sp. CALU 546]|uniref:hypothetical protein n=1 Tax=Nostoc sp. CALU 546 TaxID=1867241 RepID=UPI003B675C60